MTRTEALQIVINAAREWGSSQYEDVRPEELDEGDKKDDEELQEAIRICQDGVDRITHRDDIV